MSNYRNTTDHRRGVDHKDAKLTPEKVLEARKLWDGGKGVSCYRLAKDYGVGYTTMNMALTGTTWRSVGRVRTPGRCLT